jgi:hypothetical protein
MDVNDVEDIASPSSASRTSAANPENSGIRQAAASLKIAQSECYLQSVLGLRDDVKAMRHAGT